MDLVLMVVLGIVLLVCLMVFGGWLMDLRDKKMEYEMLRVLILRALQLKRGNELMAEIDDARLNETPHYEEEMSIIEAMINRALTRDKFHDFANEVEDAYLSVPNSLGKWERVFKHLQWLIGKHSISIMG